MITYESYLETNGFKKHVGDSEFCTLGQTYDVNNPYIQGQFWFYETEDYIFSIHKFYIKQEFVKEDTSDEVPPFALISSYLKQANGECLTPYHPMNDHMVLITPCREHMRFLFHKGSFYHTVSLSIKEPFLERLLDGQSSISKDDLCVAFQNNQEEITAEIYKIAEEILAYRSTNFRADLFYDAKALEWLSISVNACFKHKENKIPNEDLQQLELLEKYIQDHFANDLPQELLCQIACMSKTKLKTLFKKTYHMSITEYIQRHRMHVAEMLIRNTDLSIREVAKSVGYQSHSRFTTLFKKYIGAYPSDIKRLDLLAE